MVTRSRSMFGLADSARGYRSLPDPSKGNFDLLLLDISVRALRLQGTSGIAIAIEEKGEFICRASVGETVPTLGVRFHGTEGITGECIRTGQTINCEDVYFDHRVNLAASEALGIASLVAVPILHEGRTVGVLEAFALERGAIGHRTIVKLEKLAQEVSAALAEGLTRATDGVSPKSRADNVVPFVANAGTAGDALLSVPDTPFIDFSEPSLFSRIRKRSSLLLTVFIGVLLLMSVAMVIYWRYQESRAVHPIATAKSEVPLQTANAAPDLQAASQKTAAPADIRQVEAAARRGDAEAQLTLANALAQGNGVPRDLVAAHAWYIVSGRENSKAAVPAALTAPLSAAQTANVRMKVARMYEQGVGVPRDRVTSYYWLILAEAAGAPEAKDQQQRLSRALRQSQIDTARSRASAWLTQHGQQPPS
jgi:GAF domain/Sel1 repeat